MRAYKLVRLHKDSSISSLFIDNRKRLVVGEWLKAGNHPTKGYAVRPGWHSLPERNAPHLTMKDRIWIEIDIEDYTTFNRPISQGGKWYLSERMRINRVCIEV